MKIDKKELVGALEKIQKFTAGKGGNAYPILQTVWFDGDAQTITANDLKAYARIPVKMSDCQKTVQVDRDVPGDMTDVPVPDDEFKNELKGLKAAQVAALAEYAGVSSGKKQDMVDGIFDASVASAEAEAAGSSQVVTESFCVNPAHLLKIVKAQEEDEIELTPTDYDAPTDLFGEVNPQGLSVGKHFQKLAIHNPEDFPAAWEPDHDKLAPVAVVSGKALRTATMVSVHEAKSLYKEVVRFDADNNHIVGCDGNRIHRFEADVQKNCCVPHKPLEAIAQVAGDKDITFMRDPDSGQVVMTIDDLTVAVNCDTDMAYPDYMDIFPKDAQKVTIEKAALRKLVNDANLVSGVDCRGITMTFNNGLKAQVSNPQKGNFDKADIPFTEGSIDPAIEVSLDIGFVRQALSACNSGDTVDISLESDEGRPVMIESGKFAGLLMPMSV